MFFKKTCNWGDCLSGKHIDPNHKRPSSHYCLDHKCKWVGCLEPRWCAGNLIFWYCDKHICIVEDCRQKKKDETYQYCPEHSCNWTDCKNMANWDGEDKSTLCQEHEIEHERLRLENLRNKMELEPDKSDKLVATKE